MIDICVGLPRVIMNDFDQKWLFNLFNLIYVAFQLLIILEKFGIIFLNIKRFLVPKILEFKLCDNFLVCNFLSEMFA